MELLSKTETKFWKEKKKRIFGPLGKTVRPVIFDSDDHCRTSDMCLMNLNAIRINWINLVCYGQFFLVYFRSHVCILFITPLLKYVLISFRLSFGTLSLKTTYFFLLYHVGTKMWLIRLRWVRLCYGAKEKVSILMSLDSRNISERECNNLYRYQSSYSFTGKTGGKCKKTYDLLIGFIKKTYRLIISAGV